MILAVGEPALSPDARFAAVVTLVSVVLGGLVWISRRMGQLDGVERQVISLEAKVDRVLEVTSKELNHNGGGSIKDMARDAKASSDQALGMISALHRRLDEDRVVVAGRDGEKKAMLDKLQHDTSAIRTFQALHASESEGVIAALRQHGVADLPDMTKPHDSPL